MQRLVRLTVASIIALAVVGCGKDPEVAKREYVKSGDAYVAQQKYPEAVIQYRNAVQLDPRFAQARRKLAEAYMRVGDITGAYREGVRAADLLPNDVNAQLFAGQLLLAARQFLDAQGRAEKALALQPKNVDAQILRANALAGLNKLDDAINEVEDAIRNEPDRMTSYASLGVMQLFHGDRQEAETAFRKAVEVAPKSAEAHLALANYLWVVGRQREAEQEFKTALEIDPKNLVANRALVVFYVGSQRPKDAEPYLKTIADIAPKGAGKLILADYYVALQRMADAHRVLEEVASTGEDNASAAKLKLASLGLIQGDTTTATRLVDEVLKKEPKNAEALSAKARLLLKANKVDEALTAVQAAVQANPQSSLAQYVLGLVRGARREDADAIAAFTQALKLNPRMATAEVQLAKIEYRNGRFDAAEKFAQEAISKIRGYAEAYVVLAQIRLRKGDLAKAEPIIRALARVLPNESIIQAELGELELLKHNSGPARAAFERALKIDPDRINALAGLVTLDLQESHVDAAKARLDAALKRTPKDSSLLLLAAQVAYRGKDLTATERFARGAVEADPTNLDAYTLLGGLYLDTKQVDKGIALYRDAAKRQPKAVGPPIMVGMLYQMQNNPREAQANYEQALAIDKTAPVAANNLAWLYSETGGNLDLALQLAKTAKAGLPDRPEVDDTLGWVLYKKGQFNEALPSFQQCIAHDPRNPSYQLHLGLVYAALSEKDKARDALQKSLSLNGSGADADAARRALADLKS